jgi:hypothetical protein
MDFKASYVNEGGVNISGPTDFDTNSPALVIVSSDNKLENGYPSMMVQYPTIFGVQTCAMNLVDGPFTMLNYKEGTAPICAGITVGPIKLTSQYNYSVTITDNEP